MKEQHSGKNSIVTPFATDSCAVVRHKPHYDFGILLQISHETRNANHGTNMSRLWQAVGRVGGDLCQPFASIEIDFLVTYGSHLCDTNQVRHCLDLADGR
jgi:hypothetical protein